MNTAIVYLRRFFSKVPMQPFNTGVPLLQVVAAVCVFVAAKVEEKPRKLEHIKAVKEKLCGSHLGHRAGQDPSEGIDDFKRMETALLKTLGFDMTVDHPHSHVVKCCQEYGGESSIRHSQWLQAPGAAESGLGLYFFLVVTCFDGRHGRVVKATDF
ncbi:hypothetical protein ACOMHN_004171 [Nucella lapillus]